MSPATMTRVPTAEALTLTRWSGLDGLRAVMPVWRELVEASNIDPLCNDPQWVYEHVSSYSKSDDLFGWTATDADGAPIGVFAFKREPSRGALRGKRVLMAQDGSFESDYLDFPVRPDWERAAMRALLEALFAEPGIDAVVLHALDAASRNLAELKMLLADLNTPTSFEDVPCAVTELPETFDDFLGERKKRMRSKIRQAIRRADEAGATYRWCDDAAELETELAAMYALHQSRWAASGGVGSFADEHRLAFYAQFAPRHLAEGTLRLARMDLKGTAVAYQIGLVAGDRYYQLQEGYNPDCEDLRVATALRAWGLESMIADGVRQYDFMAGASKHKTDWGGVDRPCALLAFPASARGRLGYAARKLAQRFR